MHADAVLKGNFSLAAEDKHFNELAKKIIGKEKNTSEYIKRIGLLGWDLE